MRTKELFKFIRERHKVYERKIAGLPKPWTKDAILQNFRFCNVYRELDAVTQWIATSWRAPHETDPDLWFAMVVARLVNWPDTLVEMPYPVPFSAAKFVKTLHARKAAGDKVFSSAYIVSTNGMTMDKAEYLAEHVLTPLWKGRKNVQRAITSGSLATIHEVLTQFNGMGSFLAAQVVADIKYAGLLYASRHELQRDTDWWSWAASGPGSKRGLNRVMNLPVDNSWNEKFWLDGLRTLHAQIQPMFEKEGMPPLHAQDLQNCLCEFDKYERTRLGEGRPRNNYPGNA